jgi:hypothetical protein
MYFKKSLCRVSTKKTLGKAVFASVFSLPSVDSLALSKELLCRVPEKNT